MSIDRFNAVAESCGDTEKFSSDIPSRMACYAYFLHGMNELQDRLRAADRLLIDKNRHIDELQKQLSDMKE